MMLQRDPSPLTGPRVTIERPPSMVHRAAHRITQSVTVPPSQRRAFRQELRGYLVYALAALALFWAGFATGRHTGRLSMITAASAAQVR